MKKIILFLLFGLASTTAFTQRSEAIRFNQLGYEAYTKKNWISALGYFRQSWEADDTFIYGHHNYSCVLALTSWQQNIDEIIYHLSQEIELDIQRVEKILVDPDLNAIRDSQKYKNFIINGIGFPFGLASPVPGSAAIGSRYFFERDGTFDVFSIHEDGRGDIGDSNNIVRHYYTSTFAIIGDRIIIRMRDMTFDDEIWGMVVGDTYSFVWGTIDSDGFIGDIFDSTWKGTIESKLRFDSSQYIDGTKEYLQKISNPRTNVPY